MLLLGCRLFSSNEFARVYESARSGYCVSSFCCSCTSFIYLHSTGNSPKMKELVKKNGRAEPKKYCVAKSLVSLVNQ